MTEAPGESFEPVNMVERQLIVAARSDAKAQKAFERFILEETLFVATPESRPEGIATLERDTAVQLLNVSLNDGRTATAVFTSPGRIEPVFGKVGYLGIQGRVLFEMIRAHPAVLNPGQSYGVVWEPESLASMAGLPAERVIQEDTQVMLGFPSDPPTELIERLKAVFTPFSEIEAAWLALAAWPKEQQQSWYLDVRSAAADNERIRRALNDVVEGVDMKGRPLDMVINLPQKPAGAGIVIIAPRRRLENDDK